MKLNPVSGFLMVSFLSLAFGLNIPASEISSSISEKKPVTAGQVITLPAEGNAWITGKAGNVMKMIGKGGIQNWKDAETGFKIWFRNEKPGWAEVSLKARVLAGESTIRAALGNVSKKVRIKGTDFNSIPIGKFLIDEIGYHCIELQGIKKEGDVFADIESIQISGTITEGSLYFVRDDFYWGRRGPSVHLNYQVPEATGNIRWFYNEITIPEGNDVQGSYFMANGFAEGYFGIQVNSFSERRVLFSVWSPFKTDNPREIPEKFRIKMLKKGENVYTGEFGNEGAGGQSYLKYFWKAGNTYQFLLEALPSVEGYTDFTAWFFPPESGKWQLIASFRRPETLTWVKRPHSFLENFNPETGDLSRKGFYSNQWICNSDGKWTELTRARFTADATARKKARLDYAGGSVDNQFFLKNCGFFSETTLIDTYFDRKPNGISPVINFNDLP